MNSNFTFLQTEWPSIFETIEKAERAVYTEPVMAGVYCRSALEETVRLIYKLNYLDFPFNSNLFSLMGEQEFKTLVPPQYLSGVDQYTRKIGNEASHGKKISTSEALTSIKYLYTFLKWFAQQHSLNEPSLPGSFNETLLPKAGEQQRKLKEMQEEIARLKAEAKTEEKKRREEIEQLKEELLTSKTKFEAYEAEKAAHLLELEVNKKERDFSYIRPEYTEAETRKHLIDASLKEAGWENLNSERELEYPVKGMPITSDNPSGNGFVDYVLWDDNGLPLAVIEAKRTSKEASNGKHQAFLYTNCLEEMHGQRPVIFYTNGYETHLWDDTFDIPRRVYGFCTKEELQWLIQKRKNRKDIRSFVINKDIADRWYQEEALKRVSEAFIKNVPGSANPTGAKRNALLVMATGTGKTRTAAALVELLFKGNWVKRVLFLADRNALVSQAKNNFNEYLPDYTSIDLTKDKEDAAARLVFSTYPTMMHRIDSAKKDGKRIYGIGYFDLIIIDEAHRSVYNKYKSIFDYFDALLVGLTATPKDDIDHHTYELFDCAADDPTYAYELDKAVENEFLVPPKRYDLTTQFLREGIKYRDLSDKEKEKYEETFDDDDEGFFPEEISNTALTKWLFNKDTVNQVLRALMEKGLKIEGGDKVGRTIIFAANQKHADFIVQCFHEQYPEYGGNFIALVYNGVSHVQDLIEKFCDKHKEQMPQIAVSVDMMDTGVDAPRVLNLVFFKMVRSYAKFWQMIGRGTRLCPDIFGPAQDKKEFFIFDTCGNFDFFEVNPKGAKTNSAKPITQLLFESRVQLSQLLAQTGEDENLELAKALLDYLHQQINTLNKTRFVVQMNQRYVDLFESRERWNNLSNDDIHLIEEHLSALPEPEKVNEATRRFDLLMLKMQIANLLSLTQEKGYAENLKDIAEQLSKKYTIPEVLRRRELIEHMKTEVFYKNISQKKLEEIREEIRDLLSLLDPIERKPIYTDIKDSDFEVKDGPVKYGVSRETYRSRVERFIRENKHHLTISKLNTNNPITQEEIKELERILFDGDERGTKEDFINNFGEQPLGKFIRSIVGLDISAARQAFSTFLDSGSLNADQIKFLDTIISYLTKNGTIDKAMLVEPPFNDMHDQGIFGVFEDEGQITKVVSIIDGINENAERVG